MMSDQCEDGQHSECPDARTDSYVCSCPCHMFATRKARSPVGLERAMCHPCGHDYSQHDDYGCVYYTCACGEMGERK